LNNNSFIPIYKQLADYYKGKINRQELPAESKIDSINKIMLKHEVSRETAKLVLKNLVKEGLVISVAGKGSFVSPQKAIKKEWGIVIPFYSSNMEELIYQHRRKASEQGRKINFFIHYNNPDEEIKLVAKMINEGLEAVIIVPNFDESLTAGFYKDLNSWKTKIVLVDNTMAGSHFNYVVQSYDLGVKRAIDHFKKMNDKNLLFIKNELWKGRSLVNELMEQTLKGFMSKGNCSKELFVLSELNELDVSYLKNNSIGGILTCTDIDSLRIAGRLLQWKIKMPDEVSLISYGNTELTKFFNPAISAIDCHYEEMAKRVSKIILLNDSSNKGVQHVIQPELIIRET
jgi:DNA-binding LacI/PurR family transcriptional regulator